MPYAYKVSPTYSSSSSLSNPSYSNDYGCYRTYSLSTNSTSSTSSSQPLYGTGTRDYVPPVKSSSGRMSSYLGRLTEYDPMTKI